MKTHIDAKYAAGFVDGEGMLVIDRRGRGSYVIRVAVEGVDPRPLRALRDRFGGSLTAIKRKRKPTHRPLFVWVVTAMAAEKFLRVTSRYMIAKQEQADILLRLRKTIWSSLKGRPRGHSEEEIAVKESLRQQLSALKHQTF